MDGKLDYRWRLRQVMADCGMCSTAAATPVRPVLDSTLVEIIFRLGRSW